MDWDVHFVLTQRTPGTPNKLITQRKPQIYDGDLAVRHKVERSPMLEAREKDSEF